MFRRLLLAMLFCTIIFTPQSQLSLRTSAYLDMYKQAEQLYKDENANEVTDSLALAKYQQVIKLLREKNDDSILFDSYLKCGILLTTQKKDDESIYHFLKAINVNEHSAVLPDSLSFLPWVYAGNNYYNRYNPDSALICYNKAEKLLMLYPGLREAERLYNKKGVLYYEAGDFRKSIIHFSKALSLVDSSNNSNDYFIVNYKNNIASAYRKLQEHDKALVLYKSLLHFNINRAQVLHNIGVTCLDAGNYAAALDYLKQVTYNNALKYNDIASAYLQLKKYDSAEININAAFKTYTTISLHANPDYANTLRLYGDLLMQKNSPSAALLQYQKSILETYPLFKDTTETSNPSSFRGLYHFFFLFDLLTAKAHAFEAMNTKTSANTQLLKYAFATYQSAIALAGYMEKIYGSDEAKLFLKKNAEQAYKDAVENALQLYELTRDTSYLNHAFKYIENNKASVLQANIFDLELSTLKGMPVALLQKEKKLKATLAALNVQIEQAQGSVTLTALQNQSRETAIALSQLQQQLDEDPVYHELKTGSGNMHIDELRDKMMKDELILSFYNTGKRQICFYLDKKQFGYVSLPVNVEMTAEVKQLRAMLTSPDGGDNKSIEVLSQQLYSQLIQPIASQIKKAKHLVIIPYNETSYIPFEILRSPVSGHLLLEDFSISYQYAANFLNDKQQEVSNYKVLAMAPFTQPQDGAFELSQLGSSLSEIENLPGKILSGESASKNAFIKFSSQYPVIHLATHAKVNDSFPEKSFIGFYDRNLEPDSLTHLYEQEIYHLDLTNTRLAVLSACETGDGRLVNSEGVISLSRAFSYAGCKTVITSLWKANDIATAFITKRLHDYLQKGWAIDEALQKAKLDYLHSNDIEIRFKKPSYWANLVVCGNTHAIMKSKRSWYLIGGLVIVFGFIALYMKTKKAVYRQ